MGVTVDTISAGDGKNYPKKGDTVSVAFDFLDGKAYAQTVAALFSPF